MHLWILPSDWYNKLGIVHSIYINLYMYSLRNLLRSFLSSIANSVDTVDHAEVCFLESLVYMLGNLACFLSSAVF